MTQHIKANERLFVRWRYLSARVADLGAIVQNDSPARYSEAVPEWIRAWKDSAGVTRDILLELTKETLEYLNESRE